MPLETRLKLFEFGNDLACGRDDVGIDARGRGIVTIFVEGTIVRCGTCFPAWMARIEEAEFGIAVTAIFFGNTASFAMFTRNFACTVFADFAILAAEAATAGI